ncbi:MAG: hypothetical protein KDA59_21025, partial [Planctomycetales bacterium]|nr:hypothetical protein [Planctomycetales bacterium]
PTAYPDVNGDNERSAIDVLLIVNALNLQTTNAKAAGESSFDVMFPFVAQIGHDSGKPSESRSRQYREAMRVPAVASPAALIPSSFGTNALADAVYSQVSRRKMSRHRVDNVDAVFREFASQVD